MARGYTNCTSCGKEVPLVTAKTRKGRCHQCERERRSEGFRKSNPNFPLSRGKKPYFHLRTQEDLLAAAYRSAPLMLRLFRISLPAFLVRKEHREPYRDFKSKLGPGEIAWPFCFNQNSLAMRRGFLVVKCGKPDRVWVTTMS